MLAYYGKVEETDWEAMAYPCAEERVEGVRTRRKKRKKEKR